MQDYNYEDRQQLDYDALAEAEQITDISTETLDKIGGGFVGIWF